MPLFERLPVDASAVAAAAREHYGLELGEQLKCSQNVTFAAVHSESGVKYALRATRDETGAKHARVADELALVYSLASEGVQGVCPPLHPLCVRVTPPEGTPFTLCAVRWAHGQPCDFASMRWANDTALIHAWGAMFARLHAGCRGFAHAHADIAARVQRWDETHGGLMAGVALHPDDVAAMDDPQQFGILHGDLNVSNFHVVDAPSAERGGGAPTLCVFDWDQCQRGWWEYDLAQAALTMLMLTEGGAPPSGEPVAGLCGVDAWLDTLVAGYHSVPGARNVHTARLGRMLALRKAFYARFCAQAAREGGIPADMEWFIAYINRWMAKVPPTVS